MHFIPVQRRGKAPETAKGQSWKDESCRLSREDARARLERGKNVGFVARNDLAVLDIDDEEEARELLDDELWNTLTVNTRSGGTHLYFFDGGVSDHDVSGVLEVRSEWRYVLTPGSFVDPGDTGGNGLYEIERSARPAMLVSEDLPIALRGISEADYDREPPIVGNPDEPIKNAHGWTLEKIRKEDEILDRVLDELHPESYPSKSEADYAACTRLLYWEFSPGQIKNILYTYRARSKLFDRDDYLDLTLGNAEEDVDKTISDVVDTETWRPGSVYDEILVGGGE